MLPIHRVKQTVFNYDEIPPGYYFEVMQKGGPIQRFWHREKFREIGSRIRDGEKVLDVGCGPGSFLWLLGQEKKSVQAVGADIASGQIRFAMEKIAPQFPNGRVRFQELELNRVHLPFPDNSFDVVTSIEVIEHIHPFLAHQILGEMRRVLKPEGRIILTTPNYRSFWPFIEWAMERVSPVKYHDQHISKFTPNSSVKFVEAAGFQVQELSSIYIAAPFLAVISERLARAILRFEKWTGIRFGSLLVVEAGKLDW